jgi:23S rRNA pseudouridine1911/1915/1917 synthase
VRLFGKPLKPSFILEGGLKIEVEMEILDLDLTPKPQPIPLDIIYEDDCLIVVNKPSGLVVHPAPGHPSETLVNGLLNHCPLSGGAPTRPGIVHRLDKETSGVLVVAKSDRAYGNLVEQFKRGEVAKEYLALVHGLIEEDEGLIDAPIGRDPKNRKRMRVGEGKEAVTEFRVLERFKDKTLLLVVPKTGRTHQIRVHLRYIGHPILGDQTYGLRKDRNKKRGRFMLHAYKISLWHPRTGKRITFKAPIPKGFLS